MLHSSLIVRVNDFFRLTIKQRSRSIIRKNMRGQHLTISGRLAELDLRVYTKEIGWGDRLVGGLFSIIILLGRLSLYST